MRKDYLLIIAGVIPLFFLVYIFKFFNLDERYSQFQKALLLNSQNFSQLQKDQLVVINGKISSTQPILEKDLVFLQEEEKVKQKDRSVWTTQQTQSLPLLIEISPELQAKLFLDTEGYTLCGNFVKILPVEGKDPKKHRILGISRGTEVTAYGKVQNLNPLEVHVGKSLCAETLAEYKSILQKKNLGYVLAVLFLSIPSLFLIYLGLFKGLPEKTENQF